MYVPRLVDAAIPLNVGYAHLSRCVRGVIMVYCTAIYVSTTTSSLIGLVAGVWFKPSITMYKLGNMFREPCSLYLCASWEEGGIESGSMFILETGDVTDVFATRN